LTPWHQLYPRDLGRNVFSNQVHTLLITENRSFNPSLTV
jgi:hypothetical protein